MSCIDTLIIGAGHAGLAMSASLTERGVDHVVLDRGRIGERWRSERWESLRLLTPNWMTRLPGWSYQGSDPDGYMSAAEVAGYLERYATSFGAPVESGTSVVAVHRYGGRFAVRTDRGTWCADRLVMATGDCDRPSVPGLAATLGRSVHHVTPNAYRSPAGLPEGGVLVVGAGASGAQIADELARAGRDVVLSAGRHTRLPRSYRGRDIWWWLDRMGRLDVPLDRSGGHERTRREPSAQLAGRHRGGELSLTALRDNGVRLAGRLTGVTRDTLHFADDLADTTAQADAALRRLLARIDAAADSDGVGAPEPVLPVRVESGPRSLSVAADNIATVVWATGFRRSYSCLRMPGVGPDGDVTHRRGVTDIPGLYAIGLRFQSRRSSGLIDGARHDAESLATHIAARCTRRRVAV